MEYVVLWCKTHQNNRLRKFFWRTSVSKLATREIYELLSIELRRPDERKQTNSRAEMSTCMGQNVESYRDTIPSMFCVYVLLSFGKSKSNPALINTGTINCNNCDYIFFIHAVALAWICQLVWSLYTRWKLHTRSPIDKKHFKLKI